MPGGCIAALQITEEISMSEHADNEEVKQVSANDPGIVHKLVETLYVNSGSALIGSMLAVAILTVILCGTCVLGRPCGLGWIYACGDLGSL